MWEPCNILLVLMPMTSVMSIVQLMELLYKLCCTVCSDEDDDEDEGDEEEEEEIMTGGEEVIAYWTRKHSNRMRTAHSLAVHASTTYHQMSVPSGSSVNKFKQVSGLGHQ